MNFFIIFKQTLSIWLIPIFILSFFFGKININNNFLLYFIMIFYGIIILSNILKNNKILLYIDRLFLSVLAIISFSNAIMQQKYFIYPIFISLLIIFIYIGIFYVYKNLNKKLILNFSLLSCIIEILYLLSLIVFGINSFITIQILFVAMFDICYKVIILVLSIYLKKKFNIQ